MCCMCCFTQEGLFEENVMCGEGLMGTYRTCAVFSQVRLCMTLTLKEEIPRGCGSVLGSSQPT